MTTEKKILLHEDWTAVLLGGLVIILALGGVLIPDPLLKWNNGSDLAGIFTVDNLSVLGKQALFVILISSVGAWLTGRHV